MATKFNREQSLTKPKVSSLNRKFVTTDVVNSDTTNAPAEGTNLNAIVNHAAGLNILGKISEASIKVAKKAAEITTKQLQSISEQTKDKTALEKTQSDIEQKQKQHVEDVLAQLDIDEEDRSKYKKAIEDLQNSSLQSAVINNKPSSYYRKDNNIKPNLISAVIDIDKKKGVLDAFYCRLTFNLPKQQIEDKTIRLIKVFRSSEVDKDTFRKPLSYSALEKIVSNKSFSRIKNCDYISQYVNRLNENGIENVVQPIDAYTNQRTSTTSIKNTTQSTKEAILPSPTKQNTSTIKDNLSSYLKDVNLNIDKSVSQDLNSLKNIKLQNEFLGLQVELENKVIVGKDSTSEEDLSSQQINQLQQRHEKQTTLVIAENNRLGFQEIASFSPSSIKSTTIIDDIYQFDFEDTSTLFGKVYRYFILVIDDQLRASTRSEIVEVKTSGLRVPARPKNVSYSITNKRLNLIIDVDDKLVDKFEIYRKEDYIWNTKSSLAPKSIETISTDNKGNSTQKVVYNRLKNGWLQVGEVINQSKGCGATFYDANAMPGVTYSYRIYSVDIFGNKSESPFELNSIYISNLNNKQSDFTKPSLSAEVDKFTGKVKLSMQCKDKDILWLSLTRRDETIHQRDYGVPYDSGEIYLGNISTYSTSSVYSNQKVSDGNSSTTNLLALGGFTGKTEFIFCNKVVTISLLTTKQCRVYFQESDDGNSFTDTIDVIVSANVQYTATVTTTKNAYRCVVSNQEAGATTSFSFVTTILGISANEIIGTQGDRRFYGSCLSDVEAKSADWNGWTGKFANTQNIITFIDKSARIDRTYSYRLVGIDRFGNKTDNEISNVFVFNKAMIDAPLNLSASVLVEKINDVETSNIEGVYLSWDEPNQKNSSEELMGSQEKLNDNSVRMLYQIQRKKKDEDIWYNFPLTKEKYFTDKVSNTEINSPNRPQYAKIGDEYQYRIQTLQSGNIISNFTQPLEIMVKLPVKSPLSFRARPSDGLSNPAYIMLSWDTDNNSSIVDLWEIQRVDINLYASSKITDVSTLKYEDYRKVYREASRFQSRDIDNNNKETRPFPEEHGFMDMKVCLGNTYYYRIRAVGIDNSRSRWVYAAAKMTTGEFEKALNKSVTSEQQKYMIFNFSSFAQMNKISNKNPEEKSYGLIPNFANVNNTKNIK